MDERKQYNPHKNVLDATRERIAWTFDEFEKVYVSFSAGKDSTVMLHLVMAEAIKRSRRVGVLVIDLEAQYRATVDNIQACVDLYREHIDLHWVCLPINLRNAVTNFEPQWTCWDPDQRAKWVREIPLDATTHYDWFVDRMEFEEFMVEWGRRYADGKRTAAMIGIRADESLHRLGTIVRWENKPMWKGRRFTTGVTADLFNVYPIYDWRTEDIWRFHARFPELPYNSIYDLMHRAGVPLSKQRLCQPYGDDQRQGLWLFHLLEPETWSSVVARVNGANTGALYVREWGNVAGYGKVTLPDGHTWKSYTNLLLASLPKKNRDHFVRRFQSFIKGWHGRGYTEIPDSVPEVLEAKQWAPSWRRMAKCLLRNDYWCKSLGQAQPKSDAWLEFRAIQAARKQREADAEASVTAIDAAVTDYQQLELSA
jgi:predicted phosphoadenosine phosphosulfate sulfurtransferase